MIKIINTINSYTEKITEYQKGVFCGFSYGVFSCSIYIIMDILLR